MSNYGITAIKVARADVREKDRNKSRKRKKRRTKR